MAAPTPEQLAFLTDPPPLALGRIATVDPKGMPHVVPTGWSWDVAAGELVLGGHDVPATRRARHVRATRVAAVTIDGVDTTRGWAPWAVIIRGHARVDEHAATIRVTPTEIMSWGLDGLPRERGGSRRR
ncbi:MAG TPA: pyridoxamine 5'-phosphate oxidase family protein [Intrasporangium sp.]|uniref:pyridoxamine 5'-phosphate oxidase family protein n=1 Tax=Intrasporangium sp. TaxID=1925024 RepID=UPI002B4826C3|nr:pyridoxamine 5'-phosphate oxidase family protein [Intrasporangium sp.]HKX65758.1 pyridoxamine 5'-phosphate oxidase family protein [Intrasporangium sp.]